MIKTVSLLFENALLLFQIYHSLFSLAQYPHGPEPLPTYCVFIGFGYPGLKEQGFRTKIKV